MTTDIQQFFRNKTIFVTGGTGFLGKVLLEKILRCTDVNRIYILLRPKAGQAIIERFNEISKTPLFDKLHTLRPNFMHKIHLIEGDCMLENLGISNDDHRTLIENVEVILHCAATIRFNETLSIATQINVQATMDLIAMAKEMKQLVSFVHVSTAFVNSVTTHAEERFSSEQLTVSSQDLLNIKQSLGSETFDSMSEKFVDKYPNTYTFTKAVSEEFIRTHAESLPICIVRPGVIIATMAEPFGGWIDNIQGAAGATYSTLMGVLRVINTKYGRRAPLVPVDYCANILLAAAWHTANFEKSRPTKDPTIYNFIPEESNLITWGQYITVLLDYNRQMPYSKMLWYPMIKFIPNKFLYRLAVVVYQTIPGYIMDMILKFQGSKMSVLKINEKVFRLTQVLSYFIDKDFTFATANTRQLWQSMSAEDRKMFNFDMVSLSWNDYLRSYAEGLRLFIAKEGPETIPTAIGTLK
ncbi:fatty acyl-CoA reductase wat-like, partial [Musca vetustissima]|uniref:fatty acyl-CoA reductase wat-like n=1 Tax=Musca vetustissima TaxID=27455 RepID=UPI002AB7D5F9